MNHINRRRPTGDSVMLKATFAEATTRTAINCKHCCAVHV